ncbi:hypothetical protein GBAR_LOCUS28765 [Geodia barretti]|jgi:hypothetical protein
MRR